MLVPLRLGLYSAPFSALLPPLAGVLGGVALSAYVGGGTRVWHMAGAAGPYGVLMVGAVLGVAGLLSRLLRGGPSAQPAPLVVLVGLALLPWLLGIAGTQDAMERVLAALPADVDHGDGLRALVSGTGAAMVTRLLGAWMSAALLASVALGLGLQLGGASAGREEPGQWLGAALGLVLSGLALIVALEAHQLFELLTSLTPQAPRLQSGHVVRVGARLGELHALRSACLGVLALLTLALVGRQFFPRPKAVSRWAGSLVLAALAVSVLFLDARPLRLAVRGSPSAEAGPGGGRLQVRELLVSTLDAVAHAAVPTPGVRAGP